MEQRQIVLTDSLFVSHTCILPGSMPCMKVN